MSAFSGSNNIAKNGMDLRDWFAGQALANAMPTYSVKGAATLAYEIADAMMEARKIKRNATAREGEV